MKDNQQIKISQVCSIGIELIENIRSTSDDVNSLSIRARSLVKSLENVEEAYSWLTVILAIQAISMNNFGVGAVLVSPDGRIITMASNKVFSPRFNSAGHAEMLVMDDFEKKHRKCNFMGDYSLYTSLESCPMCLTRLITAGVGNVIYVFDDQQGGMSHNRGNLPTVWLDLSNGRNYRKAQCSKEISLLAKNAFVLNVESLNTKLQRRGEISK